MRFFLKSVKFCIVALTLLVLLTGHNGIAHAQSTQTDQMAGYRPLPDMEAFGVKLIYWLQVLDQADEEKESLEQSPIDKNRMVKTITFIREDALATMVRGEVFIAEAETPTQDETTANETTNDDPEVLPPRILTEDERKALSRQILQARIVAERARVILEEMGAIVPLNKWQELFVRGPPPLAPSVILASIPELFKISGLLLLAPSKWIADGRLEALWRALLTSFFIGLIVSVTIAWLFRNWLLRRYGRDNKIVHPSYSRRLVATLVEAFGRGLMPAILIMVVVVTIESLGLLTGLFRDMVTASAVNLVLFIAVEALTRAALAPNYPDWRMTPFDNTSSRLLNRRITLLVGIFAILNAFADMTSNVGVSHNLVSFFSGISGIIFACFMLPLLQQKAWRWTMPEEDPDESITSPPSTETTTNELPIWIKIRFGLTIFIVLAAIIGIFGYINLTRFVLTSLLLTGILFGAVFLIRSLIQELITLGLEHGLETDHWFTTLTGFKKQNSEMLRNISLNILDGFLFIVSALIFLAIWGVPPESVSGWLVSAMQGITIGSYIFSLTDFILSIAAFALILMLTRAVQWLLHTRLLPKRLDLGIRQSIRLVVGYLGTIIALMIAVSTLGIDLSNIALVAGALSVGIGFGLQAMVGNFIAGLILLFERPIKPGDWIVIGAEEGIVTKISVRSTELRTFQRASVIIPNSDVLSKAVTNWNHKDSQGRVDIMVGVDYGVDPEFAAEIMRKCGEEHPSVLSFPKPRVLLMNFGDSSQDLELRVMISEIERRYDVASDLRFAIRKAFDEAGIVIPFPQRVVHLKTDKSDENN